MIDKIHAQQKVVEGICSVSKEEQIEVSVDL